MANPFAVLLGGLTGGFQGYAQQQQANEQRDRLRLQDVRQASNDRVINEDRASQRALRDAQTAGATQKAQQDAYLRTPEFQSLYRAARGGDEQAVAKVASAVAGHPDANTLMAPLVKQPKTQYDEHRGGVVNLDTNTFTPTPGVTAEPTAPVMGSPAWEKAEKFKAGLVPPSFTAFQDYNPADPNAPPTTRVLNTRTGQPGPAIGLGKAPATKIESATNTAAKARLEAAVSEMNNAHANMSDFENKLKSGQVRIGAGAQVLQRVANAFTHDDPVSQLTQSGALATLNTTDPELARYIRRGLSFAEGESMVSQRPSDFRTKMAAFLSTAGSGASPEMIADIAGRRTAILTPLNNTVKPSAPSRGGRGGSTGDIDLRSPTREQQLWDAAVAKHGTAKVLQEFGPRPGGDDE